MRFREAVLTDSDMQAVQAKIQQPVLLRFVRQGLASSDCCVISHSNRDIAVGMYPFSVFCGRWSDPLRMSGIGRKADIRSLQKINSLTFWFHFPQNRNLLLVLLELRNVPLL